MCCIYTAPLYPYIIIIGTLDPFEPMNMSVLGCEFIMFLDLIYNFLLAYRNDGDSKLITNFDKIV